MSSTRKRLSIALGGAAALGLAVASAASLGPMSSKSLGAGDTVVQSCDEDGLAVAYTNSYDNATGKYRTTGVSITGLADACDGLTIAVTLRDGSKVAVASGTATASKLSPTQSVAVTPVAAETVAGAAIVITG
jgi:hypothetical protein